MQRWEYKTGKVPYIGALETLNKHGSDGWELVSYNEGYGWAQFVMKKPIQPKEPAPHEVIERSLRLLQR